MSESMWSAVLRSSDSPVQKSSPATKRTSVFQEQSSFFSSVLASIPSKPVKTQAMQPCMACGRIMNSPPRCVCEKAAILSAAGKPVSSARWTISSANGVFSPKSKVRCTCSSASEESGTLAYSAAESTSPRVRMPLRASVCWASASLARRTAPMSSSTTMGLSRYSRAPSFMACCA